MPALHRFRFSCEESRIILRPRLDVCRLGASRVEEQLAISFNVGGEC